MKIQIRECLDVGCHFRFPQPVDKNLVEFCPLCKGPAKMVLEYQTDVELRLGREAEQGAVQGAVQGAGQGRRQEVGSDFVQDAKDQEGPFDCHVLLDNLRSVLNVGTIFRTGDGVGVSHIHLCGTTPTPEHPRFAKTALGTEHTVSWQYHANGLYAVEKLRASGRYVIGLESGRESTSLFGPTCLPEIGQEPSLLVIVGSEVAGIDPGILRLCDTVVHLPMAGMKTSLNVAVAFGIGIYQVRHGVKQPS